MSIGHMFLWLAFWCIVAAILMKIVTTLVKIAAEAVRCARHPEQSLGEFFESFGDHTWEDPERRQGR